MKEKYMNEQTNEQMNEMNEMNEMK